MKPQVSMVVTTYNRPDALLLCLKSIITQTILPDEIVIGDDGSGDETREAIESFGNTAPIPVIHVWQEDKGFRAAKSRNKAVAASNYEYIIQVDGDIILHPKFVEDHLAFAAKGAMLKGGRVRMSEKRTLRYDTRDLGCPNIFSPGLKKRFNCLRLPALSRYLSTRYRKNKPWAIGCNMSYWKEDFVAINGYDESYEGWGAEDDDLSCRMVNSGVKRVVLKFTALAYHLWHPERDRSNADKNRKSAMEAYLSGKVRAEKGVSQYM